MLSKHTSAKQIQLCAVNKHFGSTVAVSDVDLTVQAGEFLTLLGPSGCGKTTLLRMIAGLEPVSQGRILLDGEDITTVPPDKRDVSMMFQDYALFPHKNVVDNISYGLKMAGMPEIDQKRLVEQWLETIELGDQHARLPHELSGGQRQRVALARALVVEPGVLLLDEPLAALDAGLRRQLQQELKRIHRGTGVTFIAVTHDQEEAITMSDRIAIMRMGKIEQLGAPKEIYQHPKTEFVARFMGRCNIVEGTISGKLEDCTVNSNALGHFSAFFSSNELTELSSGEAIKVAIRPESIELVESGVPAIVDDVEFSGSTYRLTVVVNHEQTLEVVVSANIRPPDPGDGVQLAAKSGAATVLSRQSI